MQEQIVSIRAGSATARLPLTPCGLSYDPTIGLLLPKALLSRFLKLVVDNDRARCPVGFLHFHLVRSGLEICKTDSVNSILQSKQVVFVTTRDSSLEYTIHRDLIAKQSRALEALVNGQMEEAAHRRVVFEDLDDDTLVRFFQFAYTGDYTTPQFSLDPDIVSSPISQGGSSDSMTEKARNADKRSPESDSTEDSEGKMKKSKKRKGQSTSRVLRRMLDAKDYDIETAHGISSARCKTRPNSSAQEDYTPVLLGHARLYVFGEKWGVENLKTLALRKLHDTLSTFTLFEARRRDIVELLRFSYSDENTPDREVIDELRSLVMLYVGCEVESLSQCPDFVILLGEGGRLAQNLVHILTVPVE